MRHSTVKNILYLLRDIYKHYKMVFACIIIEIICEGVLPIMRMYFSDSTCGG